MKKYTLTILIKDSTDKPHQIEGNDLVELMSKLLILIAQLINYEKQDIRNELRVRGHIDDDIPF